MLLACVHVLLRALLRLQVMLWTNHRVMEWLRSIDLSEYAPNLRGSGVHGGLLVRTSEHACMRPNRRFDARCPTSIFSNYKL